MVCSEPTQVSSASSIHCLVLIHDRNLGATLSLLSFPILLYSSDMLAPIELLGPLTYYLFKRYQVGSSRTIKEDMEKAKSESQEAQDSKEDYAKKEGQDKKDKIANVAQNQGFLSVLAFGVVMGLVEGFWHGSAFN